METFKIGSLDVPRLFVGLWQLSGNAWGTAPAVTIRQEVARHVEKGFVAFGVCAALTKQIDTELLFPPFSPFIQTWQAPLS